jgi:predicted dehydrogenase
MESLGEREQRPGKAGKVRYAICGLSNRAIGYYVPALLDNSPYSGSAELAAILDMDLDRVRAFGEFKGLDVPSYEAKSFERMVDEAGVEAVIVTTPDGAHEEYIVKALERDLDVITEKPMVIDCRQATSVIEAERNSKGSVRVGHNYRYTQAHMQIKRMIRDGLLGRITNVELAWNIDTYHGSSYFYRWNRDRSRSGGLTLSKGCHHFDLINWWLGDVPEQVFAFGALNYYGADSPYNPSGNNGQEHSVEEQKRRCPYWQHWHNPAVGAPYDDHLRPTDSSFNLPYNEQYPPDQPMYIYDREIDIEDTYSAVVRYRGGATMTYSANFSAPWEGYILAINGTEGRLETTHYTAPSRCPFPATERQPIVYYPMFGERQIHETRLVPGGHGGADPLLLRELFLGSTTETQELGLAAGSAQGAYAVAIGEAVWRSVQENKPVNIPDLLPILEDESEREARGV